MTVTQGTSKVKTVEKVPSVSRPVYSRKKFIVNGRKTPQIVGLFMEMLWAAELHCQKQRTKMEAVKMDNQTINKNEKLEKKAS